MTIAVARDWRTPTAARDWPRGAWGPTYAAMAIFPPIFGPRAAMADLLAFLRQRSREQVIGASLAVLVTIIILIIFFVDSKINTAPPETVVFVENYPANRTDAEIIADQKKASEQRRKAAEAKRKQFQELEKRLGIE